MHPFSRSIASSFAFAAALILALARTGHSERRGVGTAFLKGGTASQPARQAVERGLAFLEKDAAKWRTERKCASCHHGTMTVWALAEAKSQGYAVTTESLAETMKWTRHSRLQRLEATR